MRNCGASVINELYLDSDGKVWAGTKAGLFSIDTTEEGAEAREYKKFSDTIIRDISEDSSGGIIVVQKTGEVYLLQEGNSRQLDLALESDEGIPRCSSTGKNGSFYIGTSANVILKVSDGGKVTDKIKTTELSSFNNISVLKGNDFWVCRCGNPF